MWDNSNEEDVIESEMDFQKESNKFQVSYILRTLWKYFILVILSCRMNNFK